MAGVFFLFVRCASTLCLVGSQPPAVMVGFRERNLVLSGFPAVFAFLRERLDKKRTTNSLVLPGTFSFCSSSGGGRGMFPLMFNGTKAVYFNA